MEKIWFIKIDCIEEGPFSVKELKWDPRVTPDTLVWREGFVAWVPMRNVAELKEVFTDESQSEETEESELATKSKLFQDDKGALILNPSFNFIPFLFWLLVLLIVISYFLNQLNRIL